MPKRSSSWTLQEEQVLKQLKQAQIRENIVDWDAITKVLNEKFPKIQRNSKQCREKYINHLKIQNRDEIYHDWSKEQMEILRDIYEKEGPSWSLMAKSLHKRSQNCIKNKFNICLRKAANTLFSLEKGRKNVTHNILSSMLEFTNSLRKQIERRQLTINKESSVYIFRTQILDLCFQSQSFDEESCHDLIKLIKSLNIKIRCFGTFKLKSKKKFKFSDNGFKAICFKQNAVVQWMNKSTSGTFINSQYIDQNIGEYRLLTNDNERLQQLREIQMLQIYKVEEKSRLEWLTFDKQVQQIIEEQFNREMSQSMFNDF